MRLSNLEKNKILINQIDLNKEANLTKEAKKEEKIDNIDKKQITLIKETLRWIEDKINQTELYRIENLLNQSNHQLFEKL